MWIKMKEIKFLSIAIGILQGMQNQNKELVTHITAEQMYDTLSMIRREIPVQKGERQSERPDPDAEVEFTTTDADGNGIPAQIKLFKLLPDETVQNFDRVNNRITMGGIIFPGQMQKDRRPVTGGKWTILSETGKWDRICRSMSM